MKNLRKFGFLFTLAAIFCWSTAGSSWAQELPTDIAAQSYSQFAKSKGFHDLASAFESIEQGKDFEKIPCGTTFCDPEHTKCIICTLSANIVNARSFTEGLCVPKTDSAITYNKGMALSDQTIWAAAKYQFNLWFSDNQKDKVLTRENAAIISCQDAPEGEGFGVVEKKGWGLWKKNHGGTRLGSDTKLYSIAFAGDEIEITYANSGDEGAAFRGCEVLPVKLYNHRQCFFCPLFAVIYRTAVNITSTSFEKLATAFATVIAVGLAIWIAFQTLTHVSSLTKQDAPKFLSGLIKQSYKFLIAFFLLQYSQQIFGYAVNPLLEAGMTMGQNLLTNQADFSQVSDEKQVNRVSSIPDTYYGRSVYISLDTFVASLQREIAFMQVIGSSLVCTGGNLMWTTSLDEFGDGFQMFIQGVVIAVFGFLLSIAFAFYLMDAVVQLGIVGALMPFLIACWPFKITSKYTGIGFNMLLNSFFVFVFIGLVISVNMNLIDSALDMTNSPGAEESLIQDCLQGKNMTRERCEATIKETGALAKIYIAINNQNNDALRKLTDISGIGFLILIFCCIFGFKFVGQTGSLAGQFASAPTKPIAPSIATMGASAALGFAKKTTQPIRKAVSDKAEDVSMNVIRGIPTAPARAYRKAKSAATAVSNFFRGKSGQSNNESGAAGGKGNPATAASGRRQAANNSQSARENQRDNRSGQTNPQTARVQQSGNPQNRDDAAHENLQRTLEASEIGGNAQNFNAENSGGGNGGGEETIVNTGNATTPERTARADSRQAQKGTRKAKSSSRNSRKKRQARKRAHRK